MKCDEVIVSLEPSKKDSVVRETIRIAQEAEMSAYIPFSPPDVTEFCKRWKVVEFALFGSAVREDFSARSDIDALVTFASKSDWSLFDHVEMRQELKALFGREVDLITRRALEHSRNDLLRNEILGTLKVLYPE